MKRRTLCNLMVVILMVIATKVHAQAPVNYFVGKWDVLVKGLPQGDAHMKFNITDSVGNLKGALVDSATKTTIPMTKIEQAPDTMTLYFTVQSYDVSLTLKKKDDDHATGSLMGMFDAVADRIKSPK